MVFVALHVVTDDIRNLLDEKVQDKKSNSMMTSIAECKMRGGNTFHGKHEKFFLHFFTSLVLGRIFAQILQNFLSFIED